MGRAGIEPATADSAVVTEFEREPNQNTGRAGIRNGRNADAARPVGESRTLPARGKMAEAELVPAVRR